MHVCIHIHAQAIQNEYGFTKEEANDPRLVAIDRIAVLDLQIQQRHDELREAQMELVILQHTATHCNTMQHPTTHCNTLQLP